MTTHQGRGSFFCAPALTTPTLSPVLSSGAFFPRADSPRPHAPPCLLRIATGFFLSACLAPDPC